MKLVERRLIVSPDFMSEFFFYADFKAKTFTWTTSQRHEFTFNVSDLHTGKVTKHSCLRRGYRINNVFAIKWSSKIAYLFELNGLNNRNYCHIIDLASQFTFCRRLQFFGSKQPIGNTTYKQYMISPLTCNVNCNFNQNDDIQRWHNQYLFYGKIYLGCLNYIAQFDSVNMDWKEISVAIYILPLMSFNIDEDLALNLIGSYPSSKKRLRFTLFQFPSRKPFSLRHLAHYAVKHTCPELFQINEVQQTRYTFKAAYSPMLKNKKLRGLKKSGYRLCELIVPSLLKLCFLLFIVYGLYFGYATIGPRKLGLG